MLCISQLGLKTYDIACCAQNVSQDFFFMKKWSFVSKIVLNYCSSNQEKLLKFKAECQEFAKTLTSLAQFAQTVKGQNNFW